MLLANYLGIIFATDACLHQSSQLVLCEQVKELYILYHNKLCLSVCLKRALAKSLDFIFGASEVLAGRHVQDPTDISFGYCLLFPFESLDCLLRITVHFSRPNITFIEFNRLLDAEGAVHNYQSVVQYVSPRDNFFVRMVVLNSYQVK